MPVAKTKPAPKAKEPKTPDPKEPSPKKDKAPKRGRRFRMFEDGDYIVMQLAPAEGDLPAGSLVPIPDVPNFENCAKALSWLRENGHVVQGIQVMVLKAHRILNVQTTKKVQVELIERPRAVLSEPAEVE